MGVVDSEPAEEEEMFSLAIEFATRISKQSAALEGDATFSSGEKRPRRSLPGDEAQKD